MKLKSLISVFLAVSIMISSSVFTFASTGTEESEKTILYSDDFSGKEKWTNISNDDFYIFNGKLSVSNLQAENESVIIFDGANADNAELEFDITPVSGKYISALIRYTDSGTYYSLRFLPKSKKIELGKKVASGLYTSISSAKYDSEECHVHVTLIGDEIAIELNGKNVIAVTDKSLTSGSFGFSAMQANAKIDNFELYRYNDVNYQNTEEQLAQASKVYVSLSGSDTSGDGSYEKPYATIDAARKAVRKLKRLNKPIDVIFREGIYRLDDTLSFTDADSGTEKAPVRYMAYEGEDVVFTGAKELDLSKFKPVTDKSVKERLKGNVRDKVLWTNLDEQNFDAEKYDFRRLNQGVAGQVRIPPQFSFNGYVQTLSRWPNVGYESIIDCEKGGSSSGGDDLSNGGTIYYNNSEPSRWTNAKDFFVEGFLINDWNSEWAEVSELDISQNAINLKYRTSYGLGVGGRWAAINLLEELDVPGEWYIDFDNNIMYWYPQHELTEGDKLEYSALAGDIVSIYGVKNFTLEGIEVTMSAGPAKVSGIPDNAGHGIYVRHSENINIKGCNVKDIGHTGIFVLQSTGVTIDGCLINNTGDNGITVNHAGDRTTHEPGDIVIKNCDIGSPGRDSNPIESAGVKINDNVVGAVIKNNVIHNTTNGAIRYNGMGHDISYNEISSAVKKSGDAGSVYAGRYWTQYGTKISYNFFHDIGRNDATGTYPASSVFWDDLQSGQEFSHNISVVNNPANTSALKIGGGIDNVAVGNTMVASTWDIIGEARSKSVNAMDTVEERMAYWDNYANKTLRYGIISMQDEVFVNKYYNMTQIMQRIKANDGKLMLENTITDNFTVDCESGNKIAAEMIADSEYDRNVTIGNDYSVFVNPSNLDYRVTKEAKEKYGISDEVLDETFDLDSIGIQGKVNFKDSYMNFELTYPENGSNKVTEDRTVLSWSRAPMADTYTYVVASDSEFTDIVETGNTVDRGATLKNLEKGKTYYWKVTAHNLSREFRRDVDSLSGIYSFTISENSDINVAGLKNSIKNASEAVKTFTEGNNPGDYRIGSVASLQQKIKSGQMLLKKKNPSQNEINEMTYEINRLLKGLDAFINPGYTTLNLSKDSKWVSSSDKVGMELDDGYAKFNMNIGAQITLDETLSNYNVMCFKTRVESFENNAWFAYGLRILQPKTAIYSQDAYYILMKENIFELQKHGVIYATAENNGKFKAGEWNDVEFGSITTENGINMLFKINGEVIFDYLDKTNPQNRPGSFGIFASSSVDNSVEIMRADNVPDGVYQFSDKILAEISEKAKAFEMLDTSDDKYGEAGIWSDSKDIYGEAGSKVRESSEQGSVASWMMESGSTGNGKIYKVSYYHIPRDDGDKNVKVRISGYGGQYETVIDLSSGTKGYVELGTFKFIDADYIGRLQISFEGSGTGTLNVSNVKFELDSTGKDMLN